MLHSNHTFNHFLYNNHRSSSSYHHMQSVLTLLVGFAVWHLIEFGMGGRKNYAVWAAVYHEIGIGRKTSEKIMLH